MAKCCSILGIKMDFDSEKSDEVSLVACSQASPKLKVRDFILAALIPISAVVVAATLAFNYLASNPDISGGIFTNGIDEVSEMFQVSITPSGPTFAIWGVIFVAQIISTLYGLSLFVRGSPEGLAYANPPVLSRRFYQSYIAGNLLNISWLFAWDRLAVDLALVILATLTASLNFAVLTIIRNQDRFRQRLSDEGRSFDVGFIDAFVINGAAIYSTWTLVATHLNLTIFLVYGQEMDDEGASLIALGILTFLAAAFTALDFLLLRRATRTLLTPYMVISWAMLGISQSDIPDGTPKDVVTVVFYASTVVAVLKSILLIIRPPISSSVAVKTSKLKG